MKKLKRILSLLLVFVMIFSLSACGKEKTENNNSSTSNSKTEKEKEEQNQAAFDEMKQYVFKETQFKSIKLDENSWIDSTFFNDGKLYQLVNKYTYDEDTYESFNEYTLYTTDISTNSVNSVKLEDLPAIETLVEDIGVPEYSNSYVSGIKFYQGSLYFFGTYYLSYPSEDNGDEDSYNYVDNSKNYIALFTWDADGKIQIKSDLFQLGLESEYEWFNSFDIIQGKIYFTTYANEQLTYVVDEDGSISRTNSILGDEFEGRNFSTTVYTEDGRAILGWYNDDWTELTLGVYDINKKTMLKQAPVSQSMMNNLYNIYPGTQSDIVYSGNDGIYTFNIGDSEAKKVCDLLASDISASYLNNLMQIDDNTFVIQYYDYNEDGDGNIASVLTKVKPEDVPFKKILTLGSTYVNNNIQKQIIKFNKSSDEYKIVFKNFYNDINYTDYEDFTNKLNTELMSGKMPDIIALDDYSLPCEKFATKGLLVDIGAMMEADSELSSKKFADNVFDAYRVNGKLYCAISSYYVSTYMGLADIVGTNSSDFTMQKLMALKSQYPSSRLMEYMTRDNFVSLAIQFSGNDLVDADTNKCNFNSDYFISVLELANTLPVEYDYSMDDGAYEDYASQFINAKTLLRNLYISSFDLSYEINGLMQNKGSIVGFPTQNGGEAVIYAADMLGISSKTSYPEACFEFVKFLYSDDYQNSVYNIPISISAMDKQIEEIKNRYKHDDEDSDVVYYPNTMWINGEAVEYDPLSDKQYEDIKNYVLSANRRSYSNQDIIKIISEETASFFEGKKSAKEVAGIINNRVQLYLNENS